MKKIIFLLIAAITGLTASAQFPMGGGAAKGAAAPPKIGHVYGKIVDSSGKAIGEASVMLMGNQYDSVSKKTKEVLIKGLTTRGNGEFSFSDLPIMGKLKLKISATGFQPVDKDVVFQMKMGGGAPGGSTPGASGNAGGGMPSGMLNAFDKDLGNIQLKQDVKQLQGIVITATKPLVKMEIDKKVFNVEKNLVTTGGTALDVMKNVPTVQVDIDGNVKLRNAAPQIFVDGRPSTLQLDQIPADAIETVEVITNPSAKYDASGGNAGILNIVLKKNKKSGYNGMVMAGVDRLGGMNGGGNFNVRQNKINISATAMGNQMRNRNTGEVERNNLTGDPLTTVNQDNLSKTKGGFLFGRLGIDYFVTNRTTFSLSGIKVHGKFNPNDVIDMQTDSLYPSGTISSNSQRITSGSREFNANGVQGSFKQLFPKEGQELTADFNFFGGKNEGNSLYTTNYYDKTGGVDGTSYQKVLSDGKNTNFTFQTDYVHPFKGTTKLEAGLRAQLRTTKSNNETLIKPIGAPDYVEVPSATNNYSNNDNVYAGYLSFTSNFKKLGYQVGLRAESSSYKGTLHNTGEEFKNNYPISLFPSLFLTYKLEKSQELQMSVTRRVNRPNFFQLIPYVDYTDSLNISVGNPNLKPEFTSSIEASYSKKMKGNHTIMTSVYYKHTTDLITRYLTTMINPVTGKEDIVSTFINANSSYMTGAEFTSVNPIKKWWDLTTNINLYNSKINSENVNEASQDAMWSWFAKVNTTFKMKKEFSVQVTADYQSKSVLPVNSGGGQMGPPGMGVAQSASQGYIRPYWGADIAVKKSFFKGNALSATLTVSDIFRTRTVSQYSYSPYFTQNYARLNNPQMVRLSLMYRFGKMDMSIFKRQSNKNQTNAMEGMQ
ncbi:TonB-dependent receptor domain-containing protein [Pollutibacter soli]|uniref:TonB-dependent receptor domain-containing protein n=1 Tax=Pollutibacter soli TaxID=3034157 RepID=UPI0030137621